MAHPVKSSEFPASPNRPASDRRRRFATVERRNVSVRERSVTPAEVAQARLFEAILQAEVAELEQLAYRLAGSLDRQPELDSPELIRDLPQIHQRIDEVQRLVQALQGRFPRPLWEGSPKSE